jgi:hypothetical protein
MFSKGRSFLQNYKKIPVEQRKAFATKARKTLEKMPTPDQPFWQKINRAIPVGTMISEYVIEFTRNFLITVARRLGAVHGQRSAENLMDKFAGQERQDNKAQPSNPGPENEGPSKPGPSNQGPSDGLEEGQRQQIPRFPGQQSFHAANPGPSNQGPSNQGPSDGLEEGQRQQIPRFPGQQSFHAANPGPSNEGPSDAPEQEAESIKIPYNDRNRAKFLEYFIGLELENYSMLDVIKLAENEFKLYQASRLSYEAYMRQFNESDSDESDE